MQLCLQFQNFLAHLRQESALQNHLALPTGLAAGSFDTGFTEGLQGELDVLQASPNGVIDHFKTSLVRGFVVGARGAAVAETLLLLGRVDLLFEVVAL